MQEVTAGATEAQFKALLFCRWFRHTLPLTCWEPGGPISLSAWSEESTAPPLRLSSSALYDQLIALQQRPSDRKLCACVDIRPHSSH